MRTTKSSKPIAFYTYAQRKRQVTPDADLLIASTAIAHRIALKAKTDIFEKLRQFGLEVELSP